MVLVLSSDACICSGCDGEGGGCAYDDCTCMVLVFRPERMLEMSVGPRMSGRLDTVIGGGADVPALRAAFKSGRLEGMDCIEGGGAVLFPARNGVPASELGSCTLVGTGGGGGL